MIGIGIDTGGTCTDAVIYDMNSHEILAVAKTETTKEDLKIGIRKALHALPEYYYSDCRMISLSTTLATNACVEGQGGKGRLILFGVNPKVFKNTYQSYGMDSEEDVMLVDCSIWPDTSKWIEPDWDEFSGRLPDFLRDCDCVSIVQMYSSDFNGAWEKKAACYIREVKDIPVILGNTLFQDRNAIRRGAGALLNSRLVPVVCQFMEAIRQVFAEKGLDAPMTIIRSDGSQMSEQFALNRPVETLLSGPAASVVGAMELAKGKLWEETENDSSSPCCANKMTKGEPSLIIDMGGTTTDIAIVKNGFPKRSQEGIQVGDWKTFVKGLFIDTFGLGGDTAIHYDFGGNVYLENYRVIPLCYLAAQYPYIEEELYDLNEKERRHPFYIHEYLVFQKEIPEGDRRYSLQERRLCRRLKEGPLSLEMAALTLGKDVYTADFSLLEKEGIIKRSGLTPTDIMHIRGDYEVYNTNASRYAAEFVARCSNLDHVEALCDHVYEMIVRRLYENILRILITTECPYFADKKLNDQMEALIAFSYEMSRGRDSHVLSQTPSGNEVYASMFSSLFAMDAVLIGVGAPAHLFIPKVADLLHTRAIIPDHAEVANAVGAIASQMIAISTVRISPVREEGSYLVLSEKERAGFEKYDDAFLFAEETGRREVTDKAREQGAVGDIRISMETDREEAEMAYGKVWFGDTLIFTAEGVIG